MDAAWTAWLLGALLGVRHALEPDHLAAVSTLVAQERRGGAGFVLGALWGVGHSAGLLLLGGALAVLQLQLPSTWETALEIAVGVMLCGLGLRAIVVAVTEARAGGSVPHRHGAVHHEHPAAGEHVHVARWVLLRRPLLVGLVHGLAGSGALVALAVGGGGSAASRLGFIAMFGLGSVCGMAVLTAMAGAGLARVARRPALATWMLGAAGCVSIGIGIAWGGAGVARLLAN